MDLYHIVEVKLVTSQYMTGLARTSREGGLGAAIHMEDLSDISGVNPVTSPDVDTPIRKSPPPDGTRAGGYSSIASLARRGIKTSDREDEPGIEVREPEPEDEDDVHVDTDPTVKELWERSVRTTNAEVAKGWIALHERIRRAGDSLAAELWEKATVPISKRNQQRFELNTEKAYNPHTISLV